MRPYIQCESSRETGNWAYVVRDKNNQRVASTGSIHLARKTLSKLNKIDMMVTDGEGVYYISRWICGECGDYFDTEEEAEECCST